MNGHRQGVQRRYAAAAIDKVAAVGSCLNGRCQRTGPRAPQTGFTQPCLPTRPSPGYIKRWASPRYPSQNHEPPGVLFLVAVDKAAVQTPEHARNEQLTFLWRVAKKAPCMHWGPLLNLLCPTIGQEYICVRLPAVLEYSHVSYGHHEGSRLRQVSYWKHELTGPRRLPEPPRLTHWGKQYPCVPLIVLKASRRYLCLSLNIHIPGQSLALPSDTSHPMRT